MRRVVLEHTSDAVSDRVDQDASLRPHRLDELLARATRESSAPSVRIDAPVNGCAFVVSFRSGKTRLALLARRHRGRARVGLRGSTDV